MHDLGNQTYCRFSISLTPFEACVEYVCKELADHVIHIHAEHHILDVKQQTPMAMLRHCPVLLVLLMLGNTGKVPHTADVSVENLNLAGRGITGVGEKEFSR